jgi:hypothetical protein
MPLSDLDNPCPFNEPIAPCDYEWLPVGGTCKNHIMSPKLDTTVIYQWEVSNARIDRGASDPIPTIRKVNAENTRSTFLMSLLPAGQF